MNDEHSGTGLRLVGATAGDEPPDSRVAVVLEVLAGEREADVARRWSVEPALVRRWVRAFVAAGAAEVTNRPRPDAAQQRDRFLTAFAHELRTPLAVAQGWTALLDDEELAPPLAGIVDKLATALRRLEERTLEVELMAAASLGRLRLDTRRTTVGDLVAELPELGDTTGETGAEVVVDPAHFRRVLRDLWWAAGLPPEPRRRRLEVAVVEPWVEVRVLREAEPIEPRVLQALFEPFDVNDDATGVTIGLYLARALVVAHGGTLGLEQDDDGSALWVRVPQRRRSPSAESGNREARP